MLLRFRQREQAVAGKVAKIFFEKGAGFGRSALKVSRDRESTNEDENEYDRLEGERFEAFMKMNLHFKCRSLTYRLTNFPQAPIFGIAGQVAEKERGVSGR